MGPGTYPEIFGGGWGLKFFMYGRDNLGIFVLEKP